MKYTILLLLIFTAACTTSDKAPEEKDFTVLVRTAEGTLYSNEEIELTTELHNRSKKNVNIQHAAPLIQVQIYNEKNEPINKILVRDDIGLNHQLAADELYNPDSKIYPRGVRTITIDQPGRYKLIGTASFSVELGDGERRDYIISSEPVEISVEEGQPIKALIASIPEHEIYMYSDEPEGVSLQVGDRSRHFDWEYMTPRQILPIMEVNDYDNDGEDELSIVLYVGSGTGISVEELHIIELNEATLEDHVFDNSVEQVSGKVSLDVELNNGIPSGEIRIDSDVYPIEFPLYDEEDQGEIHERLVFGNIIGFYTEEGQLKAKFGAGVHYENWVTPEYIGEVIADVIYQGGTFMMSNFSFVR